MPPNPFLPDVWRQHRQLPQKASKRVVWHLQPVSSIPWSRALYDRLAEVEPELSFKKDDILYVDDTLPQGMFGSWMAWQLDENAQKIQRGQIPSKYV